VLAAAGWDEITSSFPKKTGRNGSILRIGDVKAPLRAKHWRHALITVPWCTLVSGLDDPTTGGAMSDPDYAKRPYNLSDRVCPSIKDESRLASFSKIGRRLCGVNLAADFSSQLLYICFLGSCVGRLVIAAIKLCSRYRICSGRHLCDDLKPTQIKEPFQMSRRSVPSKHSCPHLPVS
jgi:hypothetical protein